MDYLNGAVFQFEGQADLAHDLYHVDSGIWPTMGNCFDCRWSRGGHRDGEKYVVD